MTKEEMDIIACAVIGCLAIAAYAIWDIFKKRR